MWPEFGGLDIQLDARHMVCLRSDRWGTVGRSLKDSLLDVLKLNHLLYHQQNIRILDHEPLSHAADSPLHLHYHRFFFPPIMLSLFGSEIPAPPLLYADLRKLLSV